MTLQGCVARPRPLGYISPSLLEMLVVLSPPYNPSPKQSHGEEGRGSGDGRGQLLCKQTGVVREEHVGKPALRPCAARDPHESGLGTLLCLRKAFP